jgi:hypothetical protein
VETPRATARRCAEPRSPQLLLASQRAGTPAKHRPLARSQARRRGQPACRARSGVRAAERAYLGAGDVAGDDWGAGVAGAVALHPAVLCRQPGGQGQAGDGEEPRVGAGWVGGATSTSLRSFLRPQTSSLAPMALRFLSQRSQPQAHLRTTCPPASAQSTPPAATACVCVWVCVWVGVCGGGGALVLEAEGGAWSQDPAALCSVPRAAAARQHQQRRQRGAA